MQYDLKLKPTKTRIYEVKNEPINFLGFNIQENKNDNNLEFKMTLAKLLSKTEEIKAYIRESKKIDGEIICGLNDKLRGIYSYYNTKENRENLMEIYKLAVEELNMIIGDTVSDVDILSPANAPLIDI